MEHRHFATSVRYAWRGIVYAWRTEPHMRIHIAAAAGVVAASCWAGLEAAEWLAILLAVTIVLVTELLNTAVEVLVDLYSPERRPQAMIIKDLAAGAVFTAALYAVVVALLVLWPRLAARLGAWW